MQVSFSILRANGEAGKVYTAEGDAISFGRSDECDVQLDDNYVSGRHAEIRSIEGRFYLQDLKSTNGTWINQNRVDGRIQIEENTVVEFGKGGPQVRVVALLGQSAASAVAASFQPNAMQGRQNPVPAGSARTVDSRPGSSQNVNLMISGVAAVCVALIGGIFLIRPFLPNRDSQPGSPAPVVDQANAAAEANEKESVVDSAEIPAQAADPVQAIDIETLGQSARHRCVWIGLKVTGDGNDSVFPLCSGWCYSDHQIVTAGTVVAEFLSAGEALTLVVYSDRIADTAQSVTVKRSLIHPKFDVSNPQSPASMENNLGMLELAEPLPKTQALQLQVADDSELKTSLDSKLKSQLFQCGYSISLEGEPLSALTIPEYSCTSVSNEEFIPVSSEKILPLIRVRFEKSLSTMRGHVVLNSHGKIVGTLQHIDETNAIMIPVDRITQLISAAANSAL